VSEDTEESAAGSRPRQPEQPSVKPEYPPRSFQPEHSPSSFRSEYPPSDGRPPAVSARPYAEAERQSRRSGRLWLLVGVAAVVLVAALGVTGYLVTRSANPGKSPTSPPPAAVLDGTYRIDDDGAKTTLNGATSPLSNATHLYVFRSACGSTGCAATGTQLDDNNHQVALSPPYTTVLHFVDGHWQKVPVRDQVTEQACYPPAGNGPPTAGANTELLTTSWTPQPDGTLRGVRTNTIVTNECGYEGAVWQTPTVATRVGDAPPAVTVADPATLTAAPATSSPAPAVAGPGLNGTYRVDYDFVHQTLNGGPVQGGPNAAHWWAFRSLCTSAGCVATGAQLSDTNQQEPVGVGRVLRFNDGHWQATPHLETTQFVTTNRQSIARVSWSWDPQPDGTLRGVDTQTVLTNEDGDQGEVFQTPLVMTRVGDVPPAAVLADPGLF